MIDAPIDAPIDAAVPTTYRLATHEDAAAMFAVQRASIEGLCARSYSPSQLAVWFEGRSPAIYRASIEGRRILLAETDGRICGLVGFDPGEITLMFVHPAGAGRGIGRHLCRWGMVEAARERSGPLKVPAMLNARAFYEQIGFVVVEITTIFRGFEKIPV